MTAENARGLTVKVDVDVSEAITGLKAVERQAKEATRALRELESSGRKLSDVEGVQYLRPLRIKEHANSPGTGVVIDDAAGKPVKFFDLSVFSTKSLAEELAKRESHEPIDYIQRSYD